MRFTDAPRDSLSLNQKFKLRFSKLTDIARENKNFPMGEQSTNGPKRSREYYKQRTCYKAIFIHHYIYFFITLLTLVNSMFFLTRGFSIHATTAIIFVGSSSRTLAVQVSDFGDSRPNYVLSAGSYIYKDWIDWI